MAEEVKEALANSSLAQEQAGVAISTSKDDIDKVNLLLDQVNENLRICSLLNLYVSDWSNG